jgi:hypothetical protein
MPPLHSPGWVIGRAKWDACGLEDTDMGDDDDDRDHTCQRIFMKLPTAL